MIHSSPFFLFPRSSAFGIWMFLMIFLGMFRSFGANIDCYCHNIFPQGLCLHKPSTILTTTVIVNPPVSSGVAILCY